MNMHRLLRIVLVLPVLAALLTGCSVALPGGRQVDLPAPPFGEVYGVVTWREGDTVAPLANAYVALQVLAGDHLVHVWTVQADEEGHYFFPLLKPGEYMLPYVLWPDQDGVGTCSSGRMAGNLGGSFTTAERASPINILSLDSLEVDLGDMANTVAAANDAGIADLGFAANFSQVELDAGEMLAEDIELKCTW